MKSEFPYKMKDLCSLTGLSRQAIHFYIQQGLLPEGRKTGRNMAWYGEEHVERIHLIQKLQQERLLPLKTIKTLFEDEPMPVKSEHRELLVELRSKLSGDLSKRTGATVDLKPLLDRLNIDLDELRRMTELGLITLIDEGGEKILRDDLWLLELWDQMRAAGFTKELGFTVDDLEIYEDVVSTLFRNEKKILFERLSGLDPHRVAEMVERILPLVHTFLAHYHTAQVRNYFAAMD